MADLYRPAQQPATAKAPGSDKVVAGQDPVLLPLTYGSWMELGLAARQMMAASQPPDARATPSLRRRACA